MAFVDHTVDIKRTLIDEIRSYLVVVEAFRAEGAHPTWAGEADPAWGRAGWRPASVHAPSDRKEEP
jgi:hypothetical protein